MRRLFIILLLSLTSQIALSQITITGRVVDAANSTDPLVGAFIRLNPKDSLTLNKAGYLAVADAKGNFAIKSKKPSCEIEVSYIGYNPVFITVTSKNVNLGNIKLTESGVRADAVNVTAKAKIGSIIGDTTQFNAAAFKTNPDATTEDLLKKMPGVTVSTDGGIEAQGEAIGKVYVNGKEYFEDDPSLALKSLPVDAVESIQLYDDKTDDAKFSGFDDGERVKTINIITKKGMMNSAFGKVYGGYGTDQRYAGGLGINYMTDNQRFVIVAQSNNVNNQGFTVSDVMNSSGGGGMRGRRGGGSSDVSNFTTSARGGITQTNFAGASYSGEFKDKLKLSASYFFNGLGSDQIGTMTQNYLSMPRYYDQASSSEGFQYNHRFRAKAEWSPNETNKITFTPRINYTVNHGGSMKAAETFDGFGGNKTNSAINNYATKLDTYNLSGDLWWQHRFKKAGRTMSLGGVVYAEKSWGDRSQNSYYGSLNQEQAWITDSIRQIGMLDNSRTTFTGSATYSEPLSKRSILNFNYSFSYDKSISDKIGLNYDKDRQDYTLLDTTTTNYMVRNYSTHNAGLGYNYTVAKKLNLTVSLRYQYAEMNNAQYFPELADPNVKYNFNAVLPNLSLRYTPGKAHALTFNYYTYSMFPSVSQLQDILDVSNILQVSTGNPNLKQSYSHNVRANYNYNNTPKNINFQLAISANTTTDYIANHRRFLTSDTIINGTVIPNGAQFTSPTNLNGYYNAGLFSNVSFGLDFIKSNASVMVFYRFVQSPSIENNIEYSSLSNSIGARAQITSNISEKVDFTVGYSPSVRLSNSNTRFDRYFSHDLSVFLNVYIWKGFYVQADGTWRNSFGTQESYSQHFGLLNAAIAQKFHKNQFEIKLSAYDLLNQNRSFRQSTTDTYTQTTTSNVLKRYFMASFMWKFDTRKSKEFTNAKANTQNNSYGPMRRH